MESATNAPLTIVPLARLLNPKVRWAQNAGLAIKASHCSRVVAMNVPLMTAIFVD